MLNCISTLGCAEMGLGDVLALARTYELRWVELRALGGTVDLPAWLAAHHGTPTRLADEVRAAGVAVAALDTSLKLNGSTDEEWQKTAAAFLPWAEALGGVNLRVFDGGKAADRAAIKIMADRVAWWRGLRQRQGWRSDIMVETHDSLLTVAANLELQAAAPGVRLLWDTHHTWKRGGEDPVATWRALAPHIVHVHVKDSISVASARHPFTYVLPGEGEFPASALRVELSSGFAGPVCLEWERLWHPYLPPLAAALSHVAAKAWW